MPTEDHDSTARVGIPYPTAAATYEPHEDLRRLAERVAGQVGASPLTTVERDALEGDDLWAGRLILRTDLEEPQIEVYDSAMNGGAGGWRPAGVGDLQGEGVETIFVQSGEPDPSLGEDGDLWFRSDEVTPEGHEHLDYLPVDGSRPLEGDVDAAGYRVAALGDAAADADALNRQTGDARYVKRQLHVERDDKDADDIFRTVRQVRSDGTLFMESVLGPEGEGPEYPERTVTWYEGDGTTVRDTITYDLTYDADGDLISEAVQA